jgi:hypothetical protein
MITRCVDHVSMWLHAYRSLQVRDGAYPTQKQVRNSARHVHVYLTSALFRAVGVVVILDR